MRDGGAGRDGRRSDTQECTQGERREREKERERCSLGWNIYYPRQGKGEHELGNRKRVEERELEEGVARYKLQEGNEETEMASEEGVYETTR